MADTPAVGASYPESHSKCRIRWVITPLNTLSARVAIPLDTVACAGLSVSGGADNTGGREAAVAAVQANWVREQAAGREQRVRTAQDAGKVTQFVHHR